MKSIAWKHPGICEKVRCKERLSFKSIFSNMTPMIVFTDLENGEMKLSDGYGIDKCSIEHVSNVFPIIPFQQRVRNKTYRRGIAARAKMREIRGVI